MLTMLATDAAGSIEEFGSCATGWNFALSPGERLAVAPNADSEAPVVPSDIAAATAAIPAALVKTLLGFVDSCAAILSHSAAISRGSRVTLWNCAPGGSRRQRA